MSSSDPLPGRLVVRSPGATLDVLDAWREPLGGSGAIGELSLEVPPGPYQVSARIAGTENTQLVVVRPGVSTEINVPVSFDAAAPVEGTRTANETHGDLAHILTGTTTDEPATVAPSRSCSLVLILRGLRGRVMAPLPNMDAPFELFDQRGRPVQLPAPTPDPWASGGFARAVGWAVPLRPGGYRLRWAGPSEQPVEHAVWLSRGWQTVLFVPQGAHGPYLPEMSVHLLKAGSSWDPYSPGWLAAEAALAALQGTTASAVDPRSADFVADADNPMLVLLTLHILGRARGAGVLGEAADNQDWTKRAAGGIRQLRRSLGRHPDVAALTEQWPRGSGGRPPRVPATPWPPLLAASLDLLLAADARSPGVIPAGSLTEAVSGQRYANSPWLLWDPEGLPLKPQPQQPPISRARPQRSPSRADGVRGETRTGRRPGRREASDRGPSGGGSADLRVDFSRFTEPLAAEPRPTTALPTAVAVEKVGDLVRGVAQVLKLPPAEAVQRLGTLQIARRLGMTRRLVESCIDFAIANENAKEQRDLVAAQADHLWQLEELPEQRQRNLPPRRRPAAESRPTATQPLREAATQLEAPASATAGGREPEMAGTTTRPASGPLGVPPSGMPQVRERMTSSVVTIEPTATVVDAAKRMMQQEKGPLPVVEGDRVVAMITDRDIIARVVAAGRDPTSVTVRDVATKDLVTIGPDQDEQAARQMMAQHQLDGLLVVEGDRLVGIVSEADLRADEGPLA